MRAGLVREVGLRRTGRPPARVFAPRAMHFTQARELSSPRQMTAFMRIIDAILRIVARELRAALRAQGVVLALFPRVEDGSSGR